MAQKKSFWTTLPGFLTGLATVITAGLSLLAVFGLAGDGNTKSSPTPGGESPSPSETGSQDRDSGGGASSGEETRVRLAPETLDFGRQTVGSASPDQTVTLTNIGTGEVAITDVQITGADMELFQVESNNCGDTIQPDYDCKVDVTFTPRSAGEFRAALVINHNADEGPTDVSLEGTGALLGL